MLQDYIVYWRWSKFSMPSMLFLVSLCLLFFLNLSTRQQVVFLHCGFRTGSSLLGELFNNDPHSFYVFEPLYGVPQQLHSTVRMNYCISYSLPGSHRVTSTWTHAGLLNVHLTGAGRYHQHLQQQILGASRKISQFPGQYHCLLKMLVQQTASHQGTI